MVMTYQLTEKVRDTAVGNIRNQRIEEEGPAHRIQERLLDLVQLEVLVTDTLLIDAYSSNGQNAVLLLQPAGIQLIIRHNPQENTTQHNSQQTGDKEDDLPRCDRRSIFRGADGDSVRDATPDDLADAVEAEPDINATALFFLRIPLHHHQQPHSDLRRLVHTCEVNSAKPGVTAASNTPRKKRMAIAPE